MKMQCLTLQNRKKDGVAYSGYTDRIWKRHGGGVPHKEEEEHPVILADARYLWHVFDNLLNNIYKYAQPGTRVYLNLERRDDKVCLIFRNTSDFRSRAI